MSSRQLKKIKQPVALDIPDHSSSEEEEEEVEVKQIVKPKFSMLDLSDESDNDDKSSEEEEEEEKEIKPQINKKQQEKQQAKKKQAKKKQQKKKNNNNKDQDDIDLDSLSININNYPIKPQLTEFEIKEQEFKELFKINQSFLNPDNELKKLFGCKNSDIKGQKKKTTLHQHSFKKKNFIFVQPANTWPPIAGLMVMDLCNNDNTTTTATTTTTSTTITTTTTIKNSPTTSPPNELKNTNGGVNYFKMRWSETYSNIQEEFYMALGTHDIQNIVAIIRQLNPYHIDALLQLGQVCLMTADYQQAGEFVEMAVFAFECVWSHLFNPLSGNCRFEYKHDQNKSCFLSIFRYIQILGRRSCFRTALEFCKILLTLDYADPLYVRLIIDYYSIKSKQFRFLTDIHCKQTTITPTNQGKLSLLPNFCYSTALAMYMMEKEKQTTKDDESSDKLLQRALLSFPMVLGPLLEKMKANFTIAKQGKIVSLENDPFFKNDPLEKRIDHLVSLFVERNHQLWNTPEILEWLKSNVQIVLDKVSKSDPLVEELAIQIKKEYETVNQQVFDHLVLSEYSDVINRLSPEVIEAMHAEGFQDIVPQRDPNAPLPQHQRRGGIGNGFQLYQQQRNQQRRIQQQHQNLRLLQQQQQLQQNGGGLEPLIQENPDYTATPANPILGFIHSLLPWNDPSVVQQRESNNGPAPGFLDDYVDYEDEDDQN